MRQALSKSQKAFGADDPKTLAASLDFAAVCAPRKAAELYQTALEQLSAQLGLAHPDTMKCEILLAESHLSVGKGKEALKVFENVFRKRTTQLGSTHPDTLKAHRGWIIALSEEGEFSKAIAAFLEAQNGFSGRLRLLVEMFFHYSLRKGVIGMLFMIFSAIILYMPILIGSLLWDYQIESPALWLLACLPVWMSQLLLLPYQILARKRGRGRHKDGLEVNLVLLISGMLLYFRSFFLFSWLIVFAPWCFLEIIWLQFMCRKGLRLKSCVSSFFWFFLRVITLLCCALRAELGRLASGAGKWIGEIPWFMPGFIATLVAFLAIQTKPSRVQCTQFFRSSVFSCIVSVSRKEVLQTQLMQAFATMLGTSTLMGITYKMYRPEALSAVVISIPLALCIFAPAFSLSVVKGMRACKSRDRKRRSVHLLD